MKKIGLIIQREYWTRVRKKSFLLITLLAPVLMALFIILIAFISSRSGSKKVVAVIDESGLMKDVVFADSDEQQVYFRYPKTTLAEAQQQTDTYDGILHIPPDFDLANSSRSSIRYLSAEKAGLFLRDYLRSEVNDKLKVLRMKQSGLSDEAINDLQSRISITFQDMEQASEKAGVTEAAAVIGYGIGFVIYLTLMLYGTMIMRSVTEEKTGRVVEVIISSVKPFELMLGKIFGVGLVGITQFIIWTILLFFVNLILGVVLGISTIGAGGVRKLSTPDSNMDVSELTQIAENISTIEFGPIVVVFILFFFFGYMLYGSLFAAIGAVAGDDADNNQSLTFIVTMPVILSFILLMNALADPTGPLAVFGSLFPFSSPIILPALMAGGLPLWRVVLSLLLLVLTVWLFIQLAGRIYRTGILMYGKKPSLKEVWRWAFSRS